MRWKNLSLLLLAIGLCGQLLAQAPATTPATATSLPAAEVPQTPGIHRLYFKDRIEGRDRRIAFALFLPPGYDANQGNWPMVTTLCGAGEVGDNHEGLFVNGPIAELNRSKELAKAANFIVLAPQCPGDLRWESKGMPASVIRIIEFVKAHWRVNANRVYLTGLSMGGTGTWQVMLQSPDTFAAIAPVSARAFEPEKVAAATKDMTVWIICGREDGDYTAGSRQMNKILSEKGIDVLLSEVPGEGHGVWGRYYPQKAFYDFLLLHRRGQKPPKNRPIAEQLLAIGYTHPNSQDAKLAGDLKKFLPYWQILNCGAEPKGPPPGLKPDIDGRADAFVTHPLDAQTPCRFLTTASPPKGKLARLNLTVGHAPKAAWRLVVRADREDLFSRTIGDAAGPTTRPASAWEDVSVDLTRFAGQDVQLEVLNYAAAPNTPAGALWGKIELSYFDPPKPPPPDWPFVSMGFAGAVLLYLAGMAAVRGWRRRLQPQRAQRTQSKQG